MSFGRKNMGGFLEPWRQCAGTRKDGEPCQRMVAFWSGDYCHWHENQDPKNTSRSTPMEYEVKASGTSEVIGGTVIISIAAISFWFAPWETFACFLMLMWASFWFS
jgi:hypothetical protein